jgi:DnaJ-like protein
MAFERIAELKIREAMQAGEFDNLPNAGSRLDLEEYFRLPPHLRMAYSVLKSADCLPEEVILFKEIERLETVLAGDLEPARRAALASTLHDTRLRLAIALERLQSQARARSSAG